MPHNQIVSRHTIIAAWSNWAIAYGAITLVLFCSLFIPKVWLPLVPFVLSYLINYANINHKTRPGETPNCSLITRGAALILFWSALIMTVINLLHARWFFGGIYNAASYNPNHPYICGMVLFPTSIAVILYMMVKGLELKSCYNCQMRFGFHPGRGILSNFYYNESRYQLRLLLWISLILGSIIVSYYYFFYVNVNYNNRDKFYFIVMPIIVYVISLVFMTARYSAMIDRVGNRVGNRKIAPTMTAVRFMVLCADKMLVYNDNGEIDSPAMQIIPYRKNLDIDEARKLFTDHSGIKDFEIKYIYTDQSIETDSNIFHFAIFLPSESQGSLRGEWIGLNGIDRYIKTGEAAPLLINEMYRIYNVTMAWKTYSRDGRRLYAIKNYHPTFRLRDLASWDVDYNDLEWLRIASNNEDKPFFRLRRIWRKFFKHA